MYVLCPIRSTCARTMFQNISIIYLYSFFMEFCFCFSVNFVNSVNCISLVVYFISIIFFSFFILLFYICFCIFSVQFCLKKFYGIVNILRVRTIEQLWKEVVDICKSKFLWNLVKCRSNSGKSLQKQIRHRMQ